MEKRYEEYAYVLDFLPRGRPTRGRYRAGAIAQVIGEEYFTLLEVAVKEGERLRPQERVYVGKKERSKITYIIGRIRYQDLSTAAIAELPAVIEKIVKNREKWFVNFFNTSQAITPRMHALELIPGIGKKYMWQILEEREKAPFKDFEDLQKRVNLPNPVKLLTRRILEEISGESKYNLFTRPS
ncbi:DUF655 domain-containing protein [Candidatus Bathyarchaeota archaeon]|nr:MAG: hypothetical protein CP083_02075 [Candidatus Bathyarchaeota archaeon B24-2]RJS83114.1 MAG: DUF655 domain-containing protein [Candidatus Bathyarchaeota archaeon]